VKNKQTNKMERTRNMHKTWSAGFECSLVELHPGTPLRRDPERVLTALASTPAMAAPQSSTDSLVPPLRRRPRRLVFDRRYGWM